MSIDNPRENEDLPPPERIQFLLKEFGYENQPGGPRGAQSNFARYLDVTPQYVSDIMTGRKGISKSFAEKLSSHFNVNVKWLLYGTGPWKIPARGMTESRPVYRALTDEDLVDTIRDRLQRRSRLPEPLIIAEDPAKVENLEGRDVYRAIPYASMPAAAGTGRVVGDMIAGYVVIHQRVASNVDNLVAVQIAGDSMWPVLPNGSIVAIDHSKRDVARLDGKIVASRVEMPEEVVIKRLHVSTDRLFLSSDNPGQEHQNPIQLNLVDWEDRQIPILGQVVWAWQDFR